MDTITNFLACDYLSFATGMWSAVAFKTDMAVALIKNPSPVHGVITKAHGLALPWTTTKCAVQVERLTGMAMVASTTTDYNTAFLYSLALASEVDPGGQFTLSDRQAEVSFKLCRVWQTTAKRATAALSGSAVGEAPAGVPGRGVQPGGVRGGDDLEMTGGDSEENSDSDRDSERGERGEEKEWAPLAWEDTGVPLPDDLRAVLHRFAAGNLAFDARQLLEQMPRWQEIKVRAEQNNHRSDGSRTTDKLLKQTQQKVLSLQRIFPLIHSELKPGSDIGQLSQQFWSLLLDLEKFLVLKRKEMSLPQTVQSSEPQLFTVEDLRHDAQQSKINKAGGVYTKYFGSLQRKKSCFFVAGWSKSRFKGSKGYKSFGAKSGFGSAYGQGFGGRGYQSGYQGRGAFTRSKPKGGKCPAPSGHSTKIHHNGIHSDPKNKTTSATVPRYVSECVSRSESNDKSYAKGKLVGGHPLHKRLQHSLDWW